MLNTLFEVKVGKYENGKDAVIEGSISTSLHSFVYSCRSKHEVDYSIFPYCWGVSVLLAKVLKIAGLYEPGYTIIDFAYEFIGIKHHQNFMFFLAKLIDLSG